MEHWLSLITSLPAKNTALRQRIWRALKASGAAVLRDGVYLMPERENCRATLDQLAAGVRQAGGYALVLRLEEPDNAGFMERFNRGDEYAVLLTDIAQMHGALRLQSVQEVAKGVRKLRKAFASIAATDFFSGAAQRQAEAALCDLELALARAQCADEPHSAEGPIMPRAVSQYQGRTWATRQRPWVDRLASAWLVRRFIDPEARILWLASPADCPSDALGFDFDGAAFSHVGGRVTFEVLAASFGLQQASIARLGQLVHYLDVGGVQPSEASGVELVLAGLRASLADDDHLLAAASAVFDGLLASFDKGDALL